MVKEKEEREGLVGCEQGGEEEAQDVAEDGETRERSVEERLRLRPMVDERWTGVLEEERIWVWVIWIVLLVRKKQWVERRREWIQCGEAGLERQTTRRAGLLNWRVAPYKYVTSASKQCP